MRVVRVSVFQCNKHNNNNNNNSIGYLMCNQRLMQIFQALSKQKHIKIIQWKQIPLLFGPCNSIYEPAGIIIILHSQAKNDEESEIFRTRMQ